MKKPVLHPDQLNPGDMVGPWLITRVLGEGGSSRVFKVERDGQPYSLKVGLRPLCDSPEDLHEEEYVEERSAWRRLAREAAALFTYASHPNLLRVYGVDFWPSPSTGYPFLVTDYVDGDTWKRWRRRKPPHAASVVRTFREVVLTVGALHARGVHHRDLKAENILIRRADGRPFLIDFGTARLPGALTQTLGLPEGVLHLLPPELLAYSRSGAWTRGKPFRGGVSADLYALGVLLYQALTDRYPFDPELSDEDLVAAIAAVPPMTPHLLNPLAPRSLSAIALKLLEKRPEGRYPDTAALLEALQEASEKERDLPTWKVPLFTSEDEAEELSDEEERLAPKQLELETQQEEPPLDEETRSQPNVVSMVPASTPEPGPQAPLAMAAPSRPTQKRWFLIGAVGLGALGLALWGALSTLAPPPAATPSGPEPLAKGSLPMSNASRPSSSLLAAWLCATAGLGCPAAQVRPPEPTDCPLSAIEAMSQALLVGTGSILDAELDINQPGSVGEEGIYRDGPVISRLIRGDGNLPAGTLLHGQLWTGPSIDEVWRKGRRPAVMGRYTEAVLPDGRKYPVCIVLGNREEGRIGGWAGSKPGAFLLSRVVPVSVVERWP